MQHAYSIHITTYTRMYSQNWRAHTGFEIANSCLRHAWEQWHRCWIAELMPFCSILSCNIVQWKMCVLASKFVPLLILQFKTMKRDSKYIQSLRLRRLRCLRNVPETLGDPGPPWLQEAHHPRASSHEWSERAGTSRPKDLGDLNIKKKANLIMTM
jgi:hypothetical protein